MFKDKLNKFLGKDETTGENNNKKKIENLVFLIVLVIITVVIINIIWNGDKTTNKEQSNNDTSKQLATTNNQTVNQNQIQGTSESNLETRLEEILSQIQGVGAVKVLLNYSESSEVVAMYNETSRSSNTQETDTEGGSRTIQETDTQKNIIYQEENGEKTPITQKIVQPKIEGAIITAKGASQANVKTNIIQAVEAVTGLATHKIQVFEMN